MSKEDLKKAGASLESGDLSEAMESIINVNIAVDLIDSEGGSDDSEGEAKGDSCDAGDEGEESKDRSEGDAGDDLEDEDSE